MEITCNNDVSRSYLTIKPETADCSDHREDFKVHMLQYNKMKRFLPMQPVYINGEMEMQYDIYSKQSLRSLAEQSCLTYRLIRKLVVAIYEAVDESESYLLNPNEIVLNPDCIYLKTDDKGIYVCYVPGCNLSFAQSMRELLQYVLEKVDHTDKQSVKLAYDLYRICLNETSTMEDYLQILSGIEGGDKKVDAVESKIGVNQIEKTAINIESNEQGKLPKLTWSEPDKQKDLTSSLPIIAAFGVFGIVIWFILR